MFYTSICNLLLLLDATNKQVNTPCVKLKPEMKSRNRKYRYQAKRGLKPEKQKRHHLTRNDVSKTGTKHGSSCMKPKDTFR